MNDFQLVRDTQDLTAGQVVIFKHGALQSSPVEPCIIVSSEGSLVVISCKHEWAYSVNMFTRAGNLMDNDGNYLGKLTFSLDVPIPDFDEEISSQQAKLLLKKIVPS